MANLSAAVNRKLLPPLSPAAADSVAGDADPFRFDEVQKRLSLIEKSMYAHKALTIEFETLGIKPEHMLEHLCRTMCSRGLATHLESMVSYELCEKWNRGPVRIAELRDRERVRAALKLAPNPADLVFECSRYVENGDAYVVFMELFLQMIGDGEVEIAESTKQAAHARARRWRKLYRACGGWSDDQRIQARAFLFFLCSFGIPNSDSDSDFGSDYIMNLVILSHPCEISGTLRQSRVLVPMIPDMIKKMIERKMYGEAIDATLSFGIEDKFPHKSITDSFAVEYKRKSMGWSRCGSVKELDNANAELTIRSHCVFGAFRDHSTRPSTSLLDCMTELVRTLRMARRDLKSNGDSAADVKRKRDEMDMETETETEHPPLARRLMRCMAARKRPREEPVICHLI